MERSEWGGRMAVGAVGRTRSAGAAVRRLSAAVSGRPAVAECGRAAVRSWPAVTERGRAVVRGGPAVAERRRGRRDGAAEVDCRRGTSCQVGFTATELLVALAVAGVLVTLAVPGFAALTQSVGLSSAANELLTALHMARSSAVLRGLPVAVCLTSDDRTCVGVPDSAATGWLVFVPDGAAAVSRPAVVGEVLSRFRLPDRLTVSGSRPTVTFWPVSRAAATSTFELCDLAGAGRSIVVSQTGRPRVATEATSCA